MSFKMLKNRKAWLTFGAVAVVVIILATSVSFAYRSTVFVQYYPSSSNFNREPNVSVPDTVSNWSMPVSDAGHNGVVYFTLLGLLVPYLNFPKNYSLELMKGSLSLALSLLISIANVSSDSTVSSLTFFVTNCSLVSNNDTLVFPLTISNYYPNGASSVNDHVVTPSSGIDLSSTMPVYNLALLRGWVNFWLNFTVIPAVVYGPYYSVGTPIPLSFEWTANFSSTNASMA